MIPDDPVLTARVLREIELVRSWLPWFPFAGVQQTATNSRLWFVYNDKNHSAYIQTPPVPFSPTDQELRQMIRHECGHGWEYLVTRRKSVNVMAGLAIDPAAPLLHEVIAEIFARTMGEQPATDYLSLEPYSRPTPARRAFIEAAGELPDTLELEAQNSLAITAFWGRTDIPQWFRDWAGNYQTWLDTHVVKYLHLL